MCGGGGGWWWCEVLTHNLWGSVFVSLIHRFVFVSFFVVVGIWSGLGGGGGGGGGGGEVGRGRRMVYKIYKWKN